MVAHKNQKETSLLQILLKVLSTDKTLLKSELQVIVLID